MFFSSSSLCQLYFEGDLQRGADNVGCLWLHLYQVRLCFGSATDCLFLPRLLLILCIFFPYCSTVSTTFGLPQLSAYWKVIQFFLPEIPTTRKTLPSALGQSVNVNQLTLGLFLTQTWIHPHLFPYLLPFIQVACIIRKAFARIHFVSDLAERVHLVDCVSNSEQNFDINISYNSDQAFFIIQLRIILIVPFAWSILFPTRLRGLTHILGRHEICQKI